MIDFLISRNRGTNYKINREQQVNFDPNGRVSIRCFSLRQSHKSIASQTPLLFDKDGSKRSVLL